MQKNPRLSGGSFPGCELETAAKEVVRELISVSGMQEGAREMLFMMQPMPLSIGKGFQLISQRKHPSDKLGIGKSYQQSSPFIYLKTTYKGRRHHVVHTLTSHPHHSTIINIQNKKGV